MKNIILTMACIIPLISPAAFAEPAGYITFYNASNDDVTAQLSSSAFASFTLSANERKDISYADLQWVCSPNADHCSANFYVNDRPAGKATINANTGQLVQMKMSMKVHVSKSHNVLRTVVMQ